MLDFVEDKVNEWCTDLKQLSEIASREPQLAYSAFVYGLSKRRNYVCRTTPGISEKLKRLDYVIREDFIPAILNRSSSCTDELREILTLPPRFGGLDFPIMAEVADTEYSYSRQLQMS